MEKGNNKLRTKILNIIQNLNNDSEILNLTEQPCHVCKKTFKPLLQHVLHSESCKENYPLSKFFILRLPPGIKLPDWVCKCCKKKFQITSILKHLKHKTKLNCVGKYTDDELIYFKEIAAKITKYKAQKWRKKNKDYYASHRSSYYQNNRDVFAKKSSQYYIENKSHIAKRKSDNYIQNQAQIAKRHSAYYENAKVIRKYHQKFMKALRTNDYEKQCKILKEKSVYAKGVFIQKLIPFKEDKSKYALKKKTMESFENEIESAFTYLERKRQKVLEKLRNEWPLKIYGAFGYDEDKHHIVVAVDILTVNTIKEIEYLFDNFSSRPSTPSCRKRIIEKYCHDKQSEHNYFKKELLRIDNKHTEECHTDLRKRLQKWKLLFENQDDGFVDLSILDIAKQTISFFREKVDSLPKEIEIEMTNLIEEIEKTLTELYSEINEVISEVTDVICQWNCGDKGWKHKEKADTTFLEGSFENLKTHIYSKLHDLKHRVCTQMYNFCRLIAVEPPTLHFKEIKKCHSLHCECSKFE